MQNQFEGIKNKCDLSILTIQGIVKIQVLLLWAVSNVSKCRSHVTHMALPFLLMMLASMSLSSFLLFPFSIFCFFDRFGSLPFLGVFSGSSMETSVSCKDIHYSRLGDWTIML